MNNGLRSFTKSRSAVKFALLWRRVSWTDTRRLPAKKQRFHSLCVCGAQNDILTIRN